MKCPTVGLDLSVQRRSRWSRLVFAVSASLLITTAWAQNAVNTLAGSVGTSGYNNATGTSALFNFTNPSGAAVDGSGNVYVADAVNNAIRKITSGGVVTTFAGSASGTAGSANGNGTAATFSSPQGIAIDGAGNLYVADTGNHLIRMITPAGDVTTLAGTAGSAAHTDDTGAAARFNTPQGIAADRAGGSGAAVNVFVADTQNNSIRQIVVATKVVTTLAGPAAPAITSGFVEGTNNTARFNSPRAIVSNDAGTTLYVADTANHRIRQIVITAGPTATVSTLAGSGSAAYTEGTGAGASFNLPSGVSIMGSNLLVSDTLNQVIRSITTGGVTTLYAGTPGTSTPFANGLATSATFSIPTGIASNATTAYVVDTNNKVVRAIAAASGPSIGGQPTAQTVANGGTATFTVTSVTSNPPATYQWQISTNSGGSWTNLSNGAISGGTVSGATTATLTITNVSTTLNGNQFRVVASNGVNSTNSNAVSLTVTQPPVITNGGTNFQVAVNTASTAAVTATGSPAPTFAVTSGNFPNAWASLSTFETTGQIVGTPTDATGSPFTFTVTATNTGGTSASATFTVTVLTGATINTHPGNQTVSPGQDAVFTVSAAIGSGSLSYQWQRQASGTIGFVNLSEGGTYTGTNTASLVVHSASTAMTGDQFKVVVTGTIGSPVTSNAASLTVSLAPNIVSTNSATFTTGVFNSHQVSATGSPAPTFSLGGNPSFVSIDTNTGVLSATPASTDVNSSPYTFTISANNGFGTSNQVFTLTVTSSPITPTFTTNPANAVAQSGATATFTAVATGTPTPTLRWQRQPFGTSGWVDLLDDGTFSGTTTGTLTITSVAPGMSGDQYRLVAANSSATVPSSAATLTVNIGTAITTFAGLAGVSGTADGTGTNARFNTPSSIAIDSSGNFYVADAANHLIRKVSAAGVVTTLAGTAGVSGSVDGVGTAARFNGPSAVAVDSIGTVYVADTFNQTIRTISSTGVVSTLAGAASASGSVDGTGSAARFFVPSGIAVDASGTVYVADTGNHTIRRIQTNANVTTLAGAAGLVGSVDNSVGTSARFTFPTGLALDTSGNLYVADTSNHTIRKISPSGSVSTIAGTAGASGNTDAIGLLARFNAPKGVAVDTTGNVYVADTTNSTIRKIATSGEVTTLAGSPGQTGSADGIGSAARFTEPFGIAVDVNGNLYIADTRNNTIRRTGVTQAPQITTQPVTRAGVIGGTATFTANASGTPAPSYQWQRQAAGTFGFVNLSNDTTYSGVNTSTLTVSNIFASFDGDQFRVIASNGINPPATSEAATLTMGTAPSFTSAASATFRATEAGSFTVAATGTPAPTFSASTLPSWLTLNTTTGVLTGAPPESAVGQLNFTISASNGISVSQEFTLTVTPLVVAPTFTAQPIGAIVNMGESATFSVTVSGTAPLSYQWRRNGVAIPGATGSTFTVTNAQSSSEGSYSVAVSNAAGNIVSNSAQLTVNSLPSFSSQPRAQVALAGSTVTFNAGAIGGAGLTYQWRKNGVAIAGANNSSLTLTGVTTADAGNYDVMVTNGIGQIGSSLAQLTIVSAPTAPVITAQPASRTAVAGTTATLSVAASGAPAPSYQWRKNGGVIAGAVGSTLTLGGVNAGDAASYDVVVSNSAGQVTSAGANLRVIARSYAGYYFGSFGSSLGSFALFIREDNTGAFLGYLPGSTAPVMSLDVLVNDAGQFTFSQSAIATSAASVSSDGEPARAAALSPVVVSGTIAGDGSLSGTIQGGASASLVGSLASPVGPTSNVAGFYQAGATTNGSVAYTIAGPNGQAFAVVRSASASDGGPGAVNTAGQVSVPGSRGVILENISAGTGIITGTSSGAVTASFSGGSDAVLARQRLVNISSRARVATGEAVAIAGFVIAGEESKPVLIRAVGPTLGGFGVAGTLASPRLELFRGQTSIAVNTGIGTGAGRANIDAAGKQAGAFDLGAAGTDAAILTTLAPGNYTAQVSSTTNTAGVALVEVYDLSAATPGQKLLNIATRAPAGTAENVLIAGFVVPPGSAKRVLVRGVGPGLTPFGVTGVLAQPQLQLLSGSAVIAQNTNWSTSTDAAALTTASAQVGAFSLATNDSALIVTLAPGNYTAQVLGVNNTTGVALIEVYELP